MLIPTKAKVGSNGKFIPRDQGWTRPDYRPAISGTQAETGWELQGVRLDNLVVVDCDTLTAGPAWAAITGVDTYVVRTPHGLHFYYKGTIDQKQVRRFPGIDLLGTHKAYVNCPPTPGYTVLLDTEPARFDTAMLYRFEYFLANVPVIGADAIEKGSRNDTLFRIAAAYRGQGDALETISAKLAYINETRCNPPSPTSEITSIAERVAEQYDPNPEVELDGSHDATGADATGADATDSQVGWYVTPAPFNHTSNEIVLVSDTSEQTLDDALTPKPSDVVKAARQISTSDAARKLLAERNAEAEGPLAFLDYAGLRTLDPPTWAIEGVLPATGVGQLFGESYTGKSFVALDLALRMANGQQEWFGKPIVRPGPVFYCLLEGLSDWLQRIDAWLEGHPGTDASRFYTLPEQPVNLADEHSVEKVAVAVETITATIDQGPALLIFDTQSLATPGTDENSNTEMSLVMSNLKQLSQRLRCPVKLVHHTGYDQSHARGATSVHAACDFQIQVRSNELMLTKVKASKPTKWLAFDLVENGTSAYALQRSAGFDADGNAEIAIGDGQRILEMLWASGDEPLTFREIRDTLGDTRSFRKAWQELEQSGDIVRKMFDHYEGDRTVKREGWKTWGVEVDGPIEWIDLQLSDPKELDSGY